MKDDETGEAGNHAPEAPEPGPLGPRDVAGPRADHRVEREQDGDEADQQAHMGLADHGGGEIADRDPHDRGHPACQPRSRARVRRERE